MPSGGVDKLGIGSSDFIEGNSQVKHVLHITADHPDACSLRKTEAVQNLVQGTTGYRHRVYSINRRNGLGAVAELDRAGDLSTIVYRAPKYGIVLETFLKPLADWIIEDSRNCGAPVDLVHGHKLTIEGLVAQRVSAALGCPYICTVRGNTDQKYLRLKPEKRSAYTAVAENAALLLVGTPWMQRYLVRKLSLQNVRTVLLPTITKIDSFLPPSNESDRFVTAFHLDSWRLKGMPNLLRAIALLKREGLKIGLDIIGGGSEKARAGLEREIRRHGVADCVALRGPVPHERIPRAFNRYAAFVLPTLRESFGMVYIEALFSGVPILYSQDRGVDGYFDEESVGVRCDPTSVAGIAHALEQLRREAPRMKESIRALQEEGGFDRFRKGYVCRGYREILDEVCGEAVT